MKKALYPGTFDPPTLGHLDIAKRAAKLCDTLVIAVGDNPQKENATFSAKERVAFLKAVTKDIPNIEIDSFSGLLVDYTKKKDISFIIRAMRNISDFEFETIQGQMNRMLGDIETLYLMVDEKYRLISSTLVKEIGKYGKRLHAFLPPEIEDAIFKHLCKIALQAV